MLGGSMRTVMGEVIDLAAWLRRQVAELRERLRATETTSEQVPSRTNGHRQRRLKSGTMPAARRSSG